MSLELKLLAILAAAAALLFGMHELIEQHDAGVVASCNGRYALQAAAAASAFQADTQLMQAAAQENLGESQRLSNRSRDAAVGVAAADARLHQRAVVAFSGCVPAGATAAAASDAAGAAADLPADVLGRATEAARQLAAAADTRGDAGLTCQRAPRQPAGSLAP